MHRSEEQSTLWPAIDKTQRLRDGMSWNLYGQINKHRILKETLTTDGVFIHTLYALLLQNHVSYKDFSINFNFIESLIVYF